ncbi:MAG: helix-hairpin-helix domain-containing protein, partial [Chloroflexi bacterium]|nr:helix-hairpin-helix domain-containing protein [Chloroflexota bacterium]
GLERMGQKSAVNVLAALEASKQRPLRNVLHALGILHVGEETAGLLAQHFGSLDRLMAATTEDLQAVPGIGPKVAESVTLYFQQDASRLLAEKLRAAGVRLVASPEPNAAPRSSALAGRLFVITGRLEGMTRGQAEALVKLHGGAVASSVTKKTSYLVAGEDAGSKLDRAHTLNVPVITETELLAMTAGGG